ncbi:MAG: AraC family transcriptional regulator [Bacteroidia bacterium]|nr:AraC family transcriptional regulator [Bacteroidia bacterium]
MSGFSLIGIAVETTNKNNQAEADIAALWERFYTEEITELVPNKQSLEIYSVYTDYASDHTDAYTVILGHKVHTVDEVPDGLVLKEFGEARVVKYVATGKMPEAIVKTWGEIWADQSIKRAYSYDFEVYDDRSLLGDAAEADIFISVR